MRRLALRGAWKTAFLVAEGPSLEEAWPEPRLKHTARQAPAVEFVYGAVLRCEANSRRFHSTPCPPVKNEGLRAPVLLRWTVLTNAKDWHWLWQPMSHNRRPL